MYYFVNCRGRKKNRLMKKPIAIKDILGTNKNVFLFKGTFLDIVFVDMSHFPNLNNPHILILIFLIINH
jgi:hypothetical protein